jgi:L-ribulose-5-phosphate 3-epimerase
MRTCLQWPVSVCSWSFQKDLPTIKSFMDELDITHIQLALLPALQEGGQAYLNMAKQQDWTFSATMINFPCEDYSTLDTIKATGGLAPDHAWEENKKLALGAIELTAELNVEYLMMHFGFIDHSDSRYVAKFYERTRLLADAAQTNCVKILMETGQESAEELKLFLDKMNHPALFVNFDPANMILYDKGVPVDAVKILAPWIRHIHIKDGIRTAVPGTWGEEVPWGTGDVNTEDFLKALAEINFTGALAIEREAGDDRFGDIKMAALRLSDFKG